jgi:hypothetical protein
MMDYYMPVKSRTILQPPPPLPHLSPYKDLIDPFCLSPLQYDFSRIKTPQSNATTTTTISNSTAAVKPINKNTTTTTNSEASQSTSDHPSQAVANIIRDLVSMAKLNNAEKNFSPTSCDTTINYDDNDEQSESLFDTGKLRSSTFVENDLTSARPYNDTLKKKHSLQAQQQHSRDLRTYVPKILSNNQNVTPIGGDRLSNSNSNTSLHLDNLARHISAMEETVKTSWKQQQEKQIPQRRQSILKNPLTVSNPYSDLKTNKIVQPQKEVTHFENQNKKKISLSSNKSTSSQEKNTTSIFQASQFNVEKPKYVLTKVSRHIEKTIIREKIGKWVPINSTNPLRGH